MSDVRRTYLIICHRKRINVALFRRVSIRELELRRVEEFRSHITDKSPPGGCCAARLHEDGVDDNACDSEVRYAYSTTRIDEDCSLGNNRWHVPQLKRHLAPTGLTSPCTMFRECRCSRPQAASVSCDGNLSLKDFGWEGNEDSLTSCNRSATSFFRRYSRMFPFDIRGLIIQNGNFSGCNFSETPRKGTTFGCETYFNAMISR